MIVYSVQLLSVHLKLILALRLKADEVARIYPLADQVIVWIDDLPHQGFFLERLEDE